MTRRSLIQYLLALPLLRVLPWATKPRVTPTPRTKPEGFWYGQTWHSAGAGTFAAEWHGGNANECSICHLRILASYDPRVTRISKIEGDTVWIEETGLT